MIVLCLCRLTTMNGQTTQGRKGCGVRTCSNRWIGVSTTVNLYSTTIVNFLLLDERKEDLFASNEFAPSHPKKRKNLEHVKIIRRESVHPPHSTLKSKSGTSQHWFWAVSDFHDALCCCTGMLRHTRRQKILLVFTIPQPWS